MANAPQHLAEPRWVRILRSADALPEDLGAIGETVGPRKGPNKRRQGDEEDYVLRRLLAAWKLRDLLDFPCELRAEQENGRPGEPDFTILFPDGGALGIEITEAGEEPYQRWLTWSEDDQESGEALLLPFEASDKDTVAEFIRVIRMKVEAFDRGAYRTPDNCHLVVYDNTAWGWFLDKRELLNGIRQSNDLSGRFATVNLVFGNDVILDCFGEPEHVDVSHMYETDYLGWIDRQVDRLRGGASNELDLHNIAEELADLGRSERRSLASHIRNLLLHLLKHQFQPTMRTSSWIASINNARAEIEDILTESPSLGREFAEQVRRQYPRARRQAAEETGLALEALPEACPYGSRDLLSDNFFPSAR